MQRLLEIAFEGQGYRVIVATTGSQGLVQAATRNPDLVVLDLGLPDMEGEEVIRRLREWWSRPIVVISARGLPVVRQAKWLHAQICTQLKQMLTPGFLPLCILRPARWVDAQLPSDPLQQGHWHGGIG